MTDPQKASLQQASPERKTCPKCGETVPAQMYAMHVALCEPGDDD